MSEEVKPKLLNLLVVEDKPARLQDVYRVMDSEFRRLPFPLEARYAASPAEARQQLPECHMVLCDTFLPSPLGTNGARIVATTCVAAQKPILWVTNESRDMPRPEALTKWGRSHGIALFDCVNTSKEVWKEALYGLCYLHLAIQDGCCRFEGERMVAPPIQSGQSHLSFPFPFKQLLIQHFFSEKPISDQYYPTLYKMTKMGFSRK